MCGHDDPGTARMAELLISMNSHPLGSPLATKPEKDAFHQAMIRIGERYNVTDLWQARRRTQEAVRSLYASYQAVKSVAATRSSIRGIERKRESLERI